MFERLVRQPQVKTLAHSALRFLITLLVVFCVGLHHDVGSRAALPLMSAAGQNRSATRDPVLQDPQDVAPLELNKPIERGISSKQKQSYQIELTQGQYAKVEIGSSVLRAGLTVLNAAGEVVASLDVNQNSQAQQGIEIVAETAGHYLLTVEGKAKDAATQTYTIQLVVSRPASESELQIFQARRLHSKAAALIDAAKYDEALALEERVLALREKALGPESAAVANALHQLGNIYNRKGDYPRAEAAYLRAIKIRETTSGLVSNDVFSLLSNLGGLYSDMGELDRAEQVMQRALDMQEHLKGLDELRVASVFNNLALVYYGKGDYSRAEPLFYRALSGEEKAFGSDSPNLTDTLDNLSVLYQAIGNYASAESVGQRSLSIEQKAFGPEDPRIGSTLLNLGNVRYLSGALEQAEPLYQRALVIYEKGLGPEHPLVALALNNLAEVYHDRRQFAPAEPLYLRSLAIREKKLGAEHSDVGQSLNNLGNLYRDEGAYDKAEEFYLRALLIRQKALGPEHPDVVSTLSHLALLHMVQGDFVKAEDFQARAINISERNARLNLVAGSERQKLAYLDSLSEQLDRAITLNVKLAPGQSAARDLAVTTALRRKGRVQDVLSDSLASLRERLSASDVKLLDRFNETSSQLARLVFGGPQQQTVAEFQKRVGALNDQREQLEAEISRRSDEFRAQSRPVTIDAIRGTLPDNAALVEFVAYRPLSPKGITAKERYGARRYVAYVIRKRGEVQWKDLGEAAEVDKAVDALRQALRDPQRKDAPRLARAVDEKVMQPVRALLGDATQLIVSPDGELNLIPLAALVNEQGHYLIERYSLSYLTSGRDLLRMHVERASKSRPVVVADPTFGEPAGQPLARANTPLDSTPRNTRRRSVTTGDDLSQVYFAPLDGTSLEAHAILTLFPDATVLTGAQATESAVKKVDAPRILHIATHGFFLSEPGAVATGSATPAATREANANASTENPLLRSGLAFANANLRNSANKDDGILTALEASGLNLWGTKLVVLSACDTGVGEVRNGEGVYGLRRAFVLAGSESLVMSLWPISDYTTRTLMTNYYRYLKQGMGRGEALRQVQLDMLKKNPHLHPFYWANFIQAGDWTSLDRAH